MKTSDFNYDLPDELIADYPLESRSASRLLVYFNKIQHKSFIDILDYLNEGDLLVLNNSSVIPARVFGKKESGGFVEVMLERIMENNTALVQIRSGNSPKIGTKIFLNEFEAICIDRKDNFFILKFNEKPIAIFNKIGHIPLPPYIKRIDEDIDKLRYATVYENKELQNSVAAPTAGLHFDEDLLKKIQIKGINIAKINLSVGAGTFQPVKVEDIEDHDIHEEYVEVTASTINKVRETKARGNKIIAVGTTATRALETTFLENKDSFEGYTKLFIYPGFKFRAVDLLVTNFHLPKSSLLMLVSAFIGFENMKLIYHAAVKEKYRL